MPKRSNLISKEYLATQVALHEAPKGYGGNGDKWGPYIAYMFSSDLDVLDYGAGQGSLGRFLRGQGFDVMDYDPAFPAFAGSEPAPRSVVVCTDVLEHVEADKVEAVLDDIRANTLSTALIVIALTPANKLLPDGRNAHITLRPGVWWENLLELRFRSLEAIGEPSPLRPHKEIGFICYV